MLNQLVTVVMATYVLDDIGHLREAVHSILAQTHKFVEFIAVVDGPLTQERQDYFEMLIRDHCINVIFLPKNQGPAAARNVGIQAAKGQYIAIMDADDVSLPDRIATQLAFLRDHELDVMSNFLSVVDNDGNELGMRRLPVTPADVKALAPYRCPMHNPSAFGRAEIFKAYLYNANLRVSEDYDLWVRLLIDNFKLGNSTYPCVLYRQSRAATEKRRGLKYAISDVSVKLRARKMAPFRSYPVIICVAVLSSSIRLLPRPVFSLIYAFRTQRMASRTIRELTVPPQS